MTPNVTSLKAGDTISIAISTNAIAKARGIQFDLVLPSNVFENVSVGSSATASTLATALHADSSQNASFLTKILNNTEIIYVGDWSYAYDVTAQTLLTITATVKASAPAGSAALVWSGDCVYSNASNASVDFIKSNGAVSINYSTAASIPVAIAAPVAYASGQTTIATGTGYTGGSITWSPALSSGKFLAGTQYSAVGTLTAATNYQFNDNQTVAVAGASSVTYGTRSTSSVTFTAVFPSTAAKQVVTGTVAITGGSPVLTTDTLGVSLTDMWPVDARSGATYRWTKTLGGQTTEIGTASTQALSGLSAGTVVTVTVTPNTDYSGTLTASVTIGKTQLTATFAISGTAKHVGDIITPTGLVNEKALTAGSNDYTLQWMRSGVDISGATGATYTVTKNDLGSILTLKAVGKGTYTGTIIATGSLTLAAERPEVPSITATAGSGQVTVNWSAPFANGSPITGYTLCMKDGTESYNSGTLIGSGVSSYTVTGLINGVSYTFKLCATNGVGSSDYSTEATAAPSSTLNGGGAGGGAGGDAAAEDDKNKIKATGPGGSASVGVEVSGTSADVTTDNISLNQIFGQSSNGGTVNLDLSSVDKSVTEVAFKNNFVAALQTAVNSGNTSSVAVALPGGSSIELDKNVLQTICDTAGTGGLTIGIVPVAASSLSTSMQDALTGQNVGAVYEISITSGSTEVSSLGGTAKITFAVTVGSDVKSAKVYKVYPDGTTELVKSSIDLATGEVTIERHSLSTYAVVFSDKAAWINPYSDIEVGQWYYEDTEYISENNLMNGVTTTTFDPSGTSTRAMVATVLWRLSGSPASTAVNPFSDIQTGMWYTEAVTWAAEKGIVTGVGVGLFNPNANVTREEFATMLYRYAGYKGIDVTASTSANIAAFSDSSQIDSFAVSAITWANSKGIVKGRTATTIEPLGSAQRSELAAMLHRFVENSK